MGVKAEFTVEIPKNVDIEPKIRESLENRARTLITELDAVTGRVVVDTSESWTNVLSWIEGTGLRAALTGFGGQAAVAAVDKGEGQAKGVLRFTAPDNDTKALVVDGVVDGLPAGQRLSVQIHECGDLSSGCASLGDMHGSRAIATAESDQAGRLSIRATDDQFPISDLIGRSVVVADTQGRRLTCGIIARAAGVNQNFKRICACDGISLWDERNVPVAGGARSTFAKGQ